MHDHRNLHPSRSAIRIDGREAGDANAILAKAIEAAGGAEALKARAGAELVRKSDDSRGRASRSRSKGAGSLSRLTVPASPPGKPTRGRGRRGGWSSMGSVARWTAPGGRRRCHPTMLANERDQFYLYSVLQLTPLLDSGCEVDGDQRGRSATGLRVVQTRTSSKSRYHFDTDGRPTRAADERASIP